MIALTRWILLRCRYRNPKLEQRWEMRRGEQNIDTTIAQLCHLFTLHLDLSAASLWSRSFSTRLRPAAEEPVTERVSLVQTVTHMNMYSTVHSIKWWGWGSLGTGACLTFGIWVVSLEHTHGGLTSRLEGSTYRRLVRAAPRVGHLRVAVHLHAEANVYRSAGSRSVARSCTPGWRGTGAPRSLVTTQGMGLVLSSSKSCTERGSSSSKASMHPGSGAAHPRISPRISSAALVGMLPIP